jgi:hypothetical protein
VGERRWELLLPPRLNPDLADNYFKELFKMMFYSLK